MLLTNTAQKNATIVLLLTLHAAVNCHCTATPSKFYNHVAALRCLSVHCVVATHLLLLLLISIASTLLLLLLIVTEKHPKLDK